MLEPFLRHKPITIIPKIETKYPLKEENYDSVSYCLPNDWKEQLIVFSPGIPSLKKLHRDMFSDTELGTLA